MNIMDSFTFAIKNAALNRKESARFLGIAVSTLDKLRISGGGSTFLKIGRRVAYDLPDLIVWRETRRMGSTSEYPALRK
jgi:hypothetical protein